MHQVMSGAVRLLLVVALFLSSTPATFATQSISGLHCLDASAWRELRDGGAPRRLLGESVFSPSLRTLADPEFRHAMASSTAPSLVGMGHGKDRDGVVRGPFFWRPVHRGPGLGGLSGARRAHVASQGDLYTMAVATGGARDALAQVLLAGAWNGWIDSDSVIVFRARPSEVERIVTVAARRAGVVPAFLADTPALREEREAAVREAMPRSSPAARPALVAVEAAGSRASLSGSASASAPNMALEIHVLRLEGRRSGTAEGLASSLGALAIPHMFAGGVVLELGHGSRMPLSEVLADEGSEMFLLGVRGSPSAGEWPGRALAACGAPQSLADRLKPLVVLSSGASGLVFGLAGGSVLRLARGEQMLMSFDDGRGILVALLRAV